jgi:hypothetical protein
MTQPVLTNYPQQKEEHGGEYYKISREPLRVQIRSLPYICIIIWNAICCVTTYFYLSTMHSQLIWLFGSEEAATSGTQIFSLLFMIFPFLSVPLTGWYATTISLLLFRAALTM